MHSKFFKKGFTLIELLVVIAIISLLSSIVMASLSSARVKARDTQRVATLKEIQKAFIMYSVDNGGKFPFTSPGQNTCLQSSGTCWDIGGTSISTNTGVSTALAPYMPTLPTDPLSTRGKGDRYVYFYGATPHGCNNDLATMETGHFIIWEPDTLPLPGDDNACLGAGFWSCCYATSCNYGHYCAMRIDN